MPAFVYLLTDGSNTKVGLAEGLQGAAEALAAIPVGMIVDHHPHWRKFALNAGAVIGVLATAALVFSVFREDYLLVCVALAVLGVWNAFTIAPVEAIMADSVETGKRTAIYSAKYIIGIVANAIGPGAAVAGFISAGDSWTLDSCRFVLYFALGFFCVASFLLFFFSESKCLGEESEGFIADCSSPGTVEEAEEPSNSRCLLSPKLVPWLIAISEIVSALASGMTIKFFPLFFQNAIGLSPAVLNAVFVGNSLIVAVLAVLADRVQWRLGRIGVTVGSQVVGIGLLFAMTWRKLWTKPEILVPIFLLRTGLMNCSTALLQSVTMDFVPKSQRGKWNSALSLTNFGWSGSAILGGYLVDRHGYGTSFTITACMQAVAVALLVPLWPVVPSDGTSRTTISETAVDVGITEKTALVGAVNP
eukprot:TRINITY_DN95172_c0_g1_i1.p1 TRINITY_DN95172_c0_g1~~TRINITY_DN95172_c0_g1_i1.p1  ORF type:complete len:451 (-),score=56.62 TRINITY_DN95172_c0_g1_i1:7-1260(-)